MLPCQPAPWARSGRSASSSAVIRGPRGRRSYERVPIRSVDRVHAMAIRVYLTDGQKFTVKLIGDNEGNTMSNLLRRRAEDWIEIDHTPPSWIRVSSIARIESDTG